MLFVRDSCAGGLLRPSQNSAAAHTIRLTVTKNPVADGSMETVSKLCLLINNMAGPFPNLLWRRVNDPSHGTRSETLTIITLIRAERRTGRANGPSAQVLTVFETVSRLERRKLRLTKAAACRRGHGKYPTPRERLDRVSIARR